MNHTPGPWYADQIPDRCAYNIFAVGSNTALLTVQPNGLSLAQTLAVSADARLIAAAPDLLQALRDVVAMLELDVADVVSAIFVARAAIAKAEGKV